MKPNNPESAFDEQGAISSWWNNNGHRIPNLSPYEPVTLIILGLNVLLASSSEITHSSFVDQ